MHGECCVRLSAMMMRDETVRESLCYMLYVWPSQPLERRMQSPPLLQKLQFKALLRNTDETTSESIFFTSSLSS